jgi:hypothetical protein
METISPIGNTGTVWLKFSHCLKPSVMPVPTGRPVFATITRAKRSGKAATRRRPIRPPQSWQNNVMLVSFVAVSQSLIHFTWRSKV